MYLAFKRHATIAPQPAPTITSAIQLQNLAGTLRILFLLLGILDSNTKMGNETAGYFASTLKL